MSEPRVIGIPIGGAVAERVGTATPGVAQPAPRTGGETRESGAARRGLPSMPPTAGAGLAHSNPPPATVAGQPLESSVALRGLPSVPPATGASPALQASPSLPPIADGSSLSLPGPGPIFHLIGETATLDRSCIAAPESPTPDCHLEVGVQGQPRISPPAPPKPAEAPAEVRHPGRMLAVASVAALVVGSGFLIRALTLTDPVPPPLPPAWAGRAVDAVGHRAAPLGYARPTRITIARVGIHADVLALGLNQDGGVGVPPAKEPLMAAWYDRGPAPGQAGPAVITGHVDSRFAPGNRAAFYELGAVRPGDAIDVTRADKRVAVFLVDSVALVPKADFPTREVYGPTRYAALRLITCGGHYDRRTGYADNVIVYAHLVDWH